MVNREVSAHRYPVLGQCPICTHELTVTRLDCEHCGSGVEGAFEISRFSRLSANHVRFLEVFVKNRGIIKDVEAELGISYPTVRARLDEVIRELGFAPAEENQQRPGEARDERREILEALQKKDISATEASRRLATISQS